MSLSSEVVELVGLLGHKQHLERQKAQEKLQGLIDRGEVDLRVEAVAGELVQRFEGMIQSERWEDRLGAFTGFTMTAPVHHPDAFIVSVIEHCMRFLEDREPRVRLAIAECLGALSRVAGLRVPELCLSRVIDSIRTNFDRDNAEPSSELARGDDRGDSAAVDGAGEGGDDVVGELLGAAYATPLPGRGELRHGTEGWKCLETSCRCLQHMMQGVGHAFRPLATDDLRAVVYRSLLHPNRFVRESGYFALGAMVETFTEEAMETLGVEVATRIRDGLSDNWSQVRFASSTAARCFMTSATPAVKERTYPILLPGMCLNRYYVAEGVRLYSQQSWRMAVGSEGRALVARFAAEVVDYYVEQSKANNHAVREAACACMAELMAKVDRAAVAPHAPRMLRALVNCFKDDSWPVRDASCTACGRCVEACPEESKEVLPELLPLWIAHLWDNIPTVRQNSAQALGKVCQAYGADAIATCWQAVDELLPKAFDQPSESKKYTGLDNITSFGVAGMRRIRANDLDIHTNQQMFSCGSLAPKLQRGGGCIDHGFKREQEPWEASDGAVWLLLELAPVDPAGAEKRLGTLAQLAGLDTFMHAYALKETVFKALPGIARAVGKRAFKSHLEEILPPAFRALTSGHQLAEFAAGQCLGFIRDMIGPNILAGRLSEEQAALLRTSPLVPPSSTFGAGAGARAAMGGDGVPAPSALRVA